MGSEETQALVKAMESHVVILRIRAVPGRMTLDIKALTEYSGQGKCSLIQWYMSKHKEEEMRTWAQSKNWKTGLMNNGRLYFTRVES